MSTPVQATVAELRSMNELVAAQVKLGLKVELFLEQRFALFENTIKSLQNIEAGDCTQLLEEITNSSFSENQKNLLGAAIMSGCSTTGPETKTRPKRKEMQSCLNFENYLTAPEWEGLRSASLMCQRVTQICSRGASVNLKTASEKTTFRMTGILLDTAFDGAVNEDVQELHDNVKKELKRLCELTPSPCAHLTKYPVEAKDLPQDLWDYAYPEQDTPPLTVKMPSLHGATRGAKCRGGHSNKTQLQNLFQLMQQQSVQPQGSRSTPKVPSPAGQVANGLPALATTPDASRNGGIPTSIVPVKVAAPQTQLALKNGNTDPVVLKASTAVPPPKTANDDIKGMELDLLGSRGTIKAVRKKPAAQVRMLKRPAKKTEPAPKAGGDFLLLGCSRCRGSPVGCRQCRKPQYTGKRGPTLQTRRKIPKKLRC
jgi:hypothetical protein